MATAEQLKSLIHSHFSDDSERFHTVALQVAANEAKQGHAGLAFDIRKIIDTERSKSGPQVLTFPKELQGLVLTEQASFPLSSMILPAKIHTRLRRVVHEYRQQSKLKAHGLSHRRKLLLIGPPGTGKTLTSKVLATELVLPLYTIQVDRLVTKFMGETGAKLRQIFDLIRQEHGVYLFDEFDAIGGDRNMDGDVGEMRRVLNAFLQFIEQDTSDSVIVAATNNPRLLDHALFRRFDDVIQYDMPDEEQRKALIVNLLGRYRRSKSFTWKQVLTLSDGLSHGEIKHACLDATKNAILSDTELVTPSSLSASLRDRQDAHLGRQR
jgi:SpoVK/Ycf46/Vps4 family AAA+-type ATPase